MSSSSSYELVLLCFLALLLLPRRCHGGATFRLDLHHRFSDPVKRWAAERSLGGRFPPEDWPERGTVDYYVSLADRDRLFLRHRMMSFSEGNSTFQINTLGLYGFLISLPLFFFWIRVSRVFYFYLFFNQVKYSTLTQRTQTQVPFICARGRGILIPGCLCGREVLTT